MLGNLLKSPMFQSLLPQYATKLGLKTDEVEQYYIDKVPLKRGCDYQDVLNMLLFYASHKASYCTGQSINVSGGQVMFYEQSCSMTLRQKTCRYRILYRPERRSGHLTTRSSI